MKLQSNKRTFVEERNDTAFNRSTQNLRMQPFFFHQQQITKSILLGFAIQQLVSRINIKLSFATLLAFQIRIKAK